MVLPLLFCPCAVNRQLETTGVGRSLTSPPPEKTSPPFVPYSGDETKAPCKQGVSLSLLRCPRTKGEFAPPLVHPTDLPCCQEQHFLLWILPSILKAMQGKPFPRFTVQSERHNAPFIGAERGGGPEHGSGVAAPSLPPSACHHPLAEKERRRRGMYVYRIAPTLSMCVCTYVRMNVCRARSTVYSSERSSTRVAKEYGRRPRASLLLLFASGLGSPLPFLGGTKHSLGLLLLLLPPPPLSLPPLPTWGQPKRP